MECQPAYFSSHFRQCCQLDVERGKMDIISLNWFQVGIFVMLYLGNLSWGQIRRQSFVEIVKCKLIMDQSPT